MLKRALEYALILNLIYFFSFGLYYKYAVKLSLAVGAGIYILLRLVISKRRFFADFFSSSYLNKPILIFWGLAFLSTLLSLNFKNSQEVFFQRYSYYFFFFFFAVYLGKNKKYFSILFTLFLISAFVTSLGGMHDLLKIGIGRAYDNLFSQLTRLYTSFQIPAFFAGYFLYTIPIFLMVLFFHPNSKIKLLAGIGIVPLSVCLFFHFSRSSWIVLSLAVLVYFLFLNNRKWLGFFIASLILSVIFILPPSRERLFSSSTLLPASWGDRVTMWSSALAIFKEFPFFGIGPGNYGFYMYNVVPENLYREGLYHLHAHNIFLEVLAETGIFGLVSFLGIFFVFLKYLAKEIKKQEYYVDIAFFVMVIAVLLGELTASTVMVGLYNACLFWFLLGLAAGRLQGSENA